MFRRIRNHVNATTLVAVLALAFAMTGGAYAASRYIITSTKQISPKVLKTLKGANGTNGTNGTNGAAGSQGAAGPAGPQGPTGSTGATGKEGPAGKNGENGKNGETGFTMTLPKGKTETGVWSAHIQSEAEGAKGTEGNTLSSISFNIPLEAPLVGGSVWHYVTSEEQTKGTGPAQCTGNVSEPKAAGGNICLYQGATEPATGASVAKVTPPSSLGTAQGTGTGGAVAHIHYEGSLAEGVEIEGSWAVTAP
jgi:hypothetical protein